MPGRRRAATRRVDVRLFSPGTARPRGPVDYCMLMAPAPALVEQAIAVLGKVVAGQLDTSLPVGAVSGMAGAIDGLTAVRNRTIAGKIIVYPAPSSRSPEGPMPHAETRLPAEAHHRARNKRRA